MCRAQQRSSTRARPRGQTVLDLGCGSGVAGIAALSAGATRVGAHDIAPAALALAAQHATANAVDLLLQGALLLHGPCPAKITCILVGDLCYERSAASALWAWLRTAHRRGGQVLIADASRPFARMVEILRRVTLPRDGSS